LPVDASHPLSQVWLSSKNLLSGVATQNHRSKDYCYRPLPEALLSMLLLTPSVARRRWLLASPSKYLAQINDPRTAAKRFRRPRTNTRASAFGVSASRQGWIGIFLNDE